VQERTVAPWNVQHDAVGGCLARRHDDALDQSRAARTDEVENHAAEWVVPHLADQARSHSKLVKGQTDI
jgi:hypothetical protein